MQQGQRLADLRAQEARGARDIAPKSRSLGGRDALLGFKAQDEANVTAFLRQQTESITAADLALRQARESAQLYLDTLTQAQQREVDGLGKGAEVRSRDKGREQITDRYDQQRQQLDAQRRAGQLDKAHYDAELSVIKDFQSKALASYEDFYSARQKKEQDFAVGASDALADYLAASRNSAKQAEDAFSNAFKGAEDAIVQFALTGKISVKSMVQSIIADLLRIQVKRAVAGGLEGLLGMLGAFGGAGAGIGTNNTGGQLPTAGGRAIGGPVSRGGMYQVLEKGKPEMLTSGGKSYLMTGAQGGQVTPAQASDAAPVINVNIAGDATPQTARLVATLVQQALMRERRQRAYAGA